MAGLNTILDKLKPFKIGENTFVFKPMGIEHTWQILSILRQALKHGVIDSKLLLDSPMDAFSSVDIFSKVIPFLGFLDTENSVMAFVEGLLQEVVTGDKGVTYEDVNLKDANKFPAGCELILFAELAQHPSIKVYMNFFTQLKTHPAVKELMGLLNTLTTKNKEK